MIINGNQLPFGQSAAALPDVSQAVAQLFQPVTVGIIANTQVNGRTQTIVKSYIQTQGVRIQNQNNLVITKSGERIWDAIDMYFLRDVILKADDLFLFNGKQYRVLGIEDWTEYGYNRYFVKQDYVRIDEYKPVVI